MSGDRLYKYPVVVVAVTRQVYDMDAAEQLGYEVPLMYYFSNEQPGYCMAYRMVHYQDRLDYQQMLPDWSGCQCTRCKHLVRAGLAKDAAHDKAERQHTR